MTEESTIEDQTASIVAERRKRGPNKPKPQPEHEAGAEEATANEPKKASGGKLFPIKLLRNYHPIGKFLIDGVEPTEEQRSKVFAGTEISLEVEEARDIIAKGIAERNDPIG